MNRPPADRPHAVSRPLQRVRLVACDLDGTLLRRDHTLSLRTRTVLDRLNTNGITLVVVTGRSIGAWLPTARHLGLTCAAVCADGAMVVDDRGTVLAHRPIAASVLATAVADLRIAFPAALIAVERGDQLLHEENFPRAAGALNRTTRVVNRTELVSRPVSKLLIRSHAPTASQWATAVSEAIRPHLNAVDSGVPGLVEAVAIDVSKATGLAWMASHLGISQTDIVAFGDMPNDIPMLRWAGQGVVVAGAHPSVLDIADAVTASCSEDGVAAHLERLVF